MVTKQPATTPAEAPPPLLGAGPLLPGQSRIDTTTGHVTEGPPLPHDQLLEIAYQELFKDFGSRTDPATGKQVFFQPATALPTTAERVKEAFGDGRADEPPDPIEAWELRLGGSKFFVPPININVSTSFRAGSLSGGALRQTSSPKFNSGYSETVVDLTLYFPSHESIWGYAGTDPFTIDFDQDNYQVVDRFLSSLRGLVAQFRYTPFIPVRNVYLNQVHNITAVALQSMTVSTIPGFPFCLAVNLSMLKFNHRVFLPMIEHFDNAVHWGRYRQFMGRAAARLQAVASRDFLLESDIPQDENQKPLGDVARTLVGPKELLGATKASDISNSVDIEDLNPLRSYDKTKEIADGRWFEIYSPAYDPARIDLPDDDDFKLSPDDLKTANRGDWWAPLLDFLGIEATKQTTSQDAARLAQQFGRLQHITSEARLLVEFIQVGHVLVTEMTDQKFNEAVAAVIKKMGLENASQGQKDEVKARLREAWTGYMYDNFLQDPFFAKVLAFQDLKRKQIWIQEWEVPMVATGLSAPGIREAVQVQAVTVSMGNNLARLQVQMQQEPTYQHIGGRDTTCSISMFVFGEQPLIMMRRTFEANTGLARLEHGHGVLGFLGIKNIVTALCGMKYTMVSSFEVNTVPNFPHVYSVRLTLTDFDIFQQKREILSAEQQADLINVFKTKKNPFLRIKQLWGAVNSYPDFPLAVRDKDGKVVGNLDPDFYFKSFDSIDADIAKLAAPPLLSENDQANDRARRAEAGAGFIEEDGIHFCFGKTPDNPQGNWCSTTANGVQLRNGTQVVMQDGKWDEPHAGNVVTTPYVDGLTPASGYVAPYGNGEGSVLGQYERMLKDTRYRDKAGRMIRAFPTYMLWLIDEGGLFAGVRLFDNFYGLQSVIDMSLNRSEDVLGDTLVLRVSNLFSRLTTPFRDLIDDSNSPAATIINTFTQRQLRLATGLGDYLVRLDSIQIAPGTRIHLRMGYSSNPNNLDIVFNGVVTEVETGEILTITAQSDAIELGALVNTADKSGHSGKIDGDFVGFYLSEPRDLMTRLLSMGAGVFKEAFAHATQGKVFSENRFGIRHFGTILYQSMTEEEKQKIAARRSKAGSYLATQAGAGGSGIGSAAAGLRGIGSFALDVAGRVNPAIADIVDSLSINMSLKNDYELFKRNIYPGNGFGIAQYLGGDLGDGALSLAMEPTGVDQDGHVHDPVTGNVVEQSTDPGVIFGQAEQGKQQAAQTEQQFINERATRADGTSTQVHEFAKILGITSRGDDDILDEISFRAQTYMKTVWDLFQVCAALLPNYIVAVRPFEDRSTVFYGKPHWTYTSGVIPLTTGVGKVIDAGGNEIDNSPPYEPPDQEWQDLYDRLNVELGKDQVKSDIYTKLSGIKVTDPTNTTQGMPWAGGDIYSLPSVEPGTGAKLVSQTGKVGLEMHLPTSTNLQDDVHQHKQLPELPKEQQHPYYMDRVGGGVGGVSGNNPYTTTGTIKSGDDANQPGKGGAFGVLSPQDEQFYMCQPWGIGSNPKATGIRGARIMVFNKRTGKGCVCTPGDSGPAASTGKQAGLSPDAFHVLDAKQGDECFFGFVDRRQALGPIDLSKVVGFGDPGKGTSGTLQIGGLIPQVNLTDAGAPGSLPAGFSPPTPGQVLAHVVGPDATDPSAPATTDEVGVKAMELYKNQRGKDDAESIWKEFRSFFHNEGANKRTYNTVVKGQQPTPATTATGLAAGPAAVPATQSQPDEPADTAKYDQAMDSFMQFLWNNAYGRGWLVYTADAKVNIGTGLVKDAGKAEGIFGAVTRVVGGAVGDAVGIIPGADGVGGAITGASNLVGNAFDAPGDLVQGVGNLIDSATGQRKWTFSAAGDLWKVYIQQGESAATEWMRSNQHPGKDQNGIISSVIEDAERNVLEPIKGFLSQVGHVVAGIYQSFSTFVRLALLQLNNGLSQKKDMQKRTNMLNRIYNDSVYYAAGPPGSLLRLADNPFTREYGEPVVEIREPFQRVHYLDSFQQILGNKITERTDGVYTVVTATSNGKHPVTVHFDKGAPSQYQRETVVETGLYWDQPGGIPFIKSIPLIGTAISHSISSVIHPVTTLRRLNKTGASEDEMSSKRVALYHLKESLKDIYSGELVVLGDASIRPHDLCYLSDSYERMYGLFEVEAVTHHFTPEMGFVSSVVPNALVTINDPARWSMTAYVQSRFDINRIRGNLREALRVRADASGQVPGRTGYTINELTHMMEQQLLDSTQFSGGVGAIAKDIGASVASGSLAGGGLAALGANALGAGSLAVVASGGAAVPIVGGLLWGAWKWVRDNLLDQHGCYIQYLTHNGQPMDSGMQPKASVAVGRQHGTTLTLGALTGTISSRGDVPTLVQGKQVKPTKITTSELLSYIGWTPKEIDSLGTSVDSFTDETLLNVLRLTQRGDTLLPFDAYEVLWVRITKVKDGDTVYVEAAEGTLNGRNNEIRFFYANAAEDHLSDKTNGTETAASINNFTDPGLLATRYTRRRLTGVFPGSIPGLGQLDTIAEYGNTVALRINKRLAIDENGRTLALIFHQGLAGQSPGDREKFLRQAAGSQLDFQSYTSEGRPYTFDQELLQAGYARIEATRLGRSVAGSGVVGAGG